MGSAKQLAFLVVFGFAFTLFTSITWAESLVENERSFPTPFFKPQAGEYYGNVRVRMLSSGWQPVAFKCSPQSPCFSDYPELGTVNDDAPLCGLFQKEEVIAKICVHAISDSFKVDTFEYLR